MKRKPDFSQVPTRKKGRLSNPPSDYRCKSESQDLDIQARDAWHEFNLGRFEVALEAFRRIYQTICQNSPHDSPQRHSFFLHILMDISECHLALLQGSNALEVLSPCYQWGHQTSISWSNPLWSEVSSLIASSRTLIRQEEQIKTMLKNERWKEVTECISEVVKERSIKFPKSTTKLTGFWSVSHAEALMWLGHKSSARREISQKSSWYSHINEPWRHVWTEALIAYIEGDFPKAYHLSVRGMGLKSDNQKFEQLLHKIQVDYQPDSQTLYEVLGVKKTATTRQIQAAYRTLALKYHPDKTQNGNNQMMSALNFARDVLVDPIQRIQYDSSLSQ